MSQSESIGDSDEEIPSGWSCGLFTARLCSALVTSWKPGRSLQLLKVSQSLQDGIHPQKNIYGPILQLFGFFFFFLTETLGVFQIFNSCSD